MEFSQNLEHNMTHPHGHPDIEGGDESQCPHLRFMKNQGMDPEKEANLKKNKKSENESDFDGDSDVSSDDEQ